MMLGMPLVLRIAPILFALVLWPHDSAAQNSAAGARSGRIEPPAATHGAAVPEIIRDLSRLPPRAARTRERILGAARAGDLEKLLIVMQMNETVPVPWRSIGSSRPMFTTPVTFDCNTWSRVCYGTGAAAVGAGALLLLWPRITGSSTSSHPPPLAIGIAPDGVWHFFVAGD